VIALAAMSLNRVIGVDGKIPWHLPEDFKWFKKLTTGGIVLMGRKTFLSLPKPLSNRTNVVFTRAPRALAHDAEFAARCGVAPLVGNWTARLKRGPAQLGFERIANREVWLVRSIERFLAALKKHKPQREVFVIGGAQIYARLLPLCSDLYLTVVPRIVEGDATFPEFEHLFDFADVALKTADFEVRHYRRNRRSANAG
jgi:dihydrofolate reductase